MSIPQPEPRGYPGNLGQLFAERASSQRTAIIDLREPERPAHIRFSDLDAMCDACARGLKKAGVQQGDRIGIISLNRVEFVAVLLGAMRAGIVPVPVNAKLPRDSAAYILNDASARLIFVEPAFKHLVPPGMPAIEFDGSGSGHFDAFLDPGMFQVFEPLPHSIAIQPYTSGSTGKPKGVLLR